MRRSTAPSLRRSSQFISPISETQCDYLHAAVTSSGARRSIPPFPNAVRSTASILDLLSGSSSNTVVPEVQSPDDACARPTVSTARVRSQETKRSTVEFVKDENFDSNQIVSHCYKGKRLFNVVWGKQSKKKHKTWEGDGILEVVEKTVILKDTDGKVIAQSAGTKMATLEEGSRLYVGNKEVEIIDVVSSGDIREAYSNKSCNTGSKRLPEATSKASSPLLKKSKILPKSTLVCVQRNRGPNKPLIMPSPTHEHQWKHNLAHVPVVDVMVDNCLTRVLRPHQRLGIVFMYECILGMQRPEYRGAILADEMGLGKTLQCIALVWMLLKQGPYGGKPVLQRVLIVTPSSLVVNWQNEFLHWLGRERIQTFVVDQKSRPKDYRLLPQIPVMLISYEMFVRYYDDITQIHFDLLICDEGHRLKNTTIKTYALLYQLDCKRRILLTGTPIQNDLQEFYALIDFTNPGVLGSSTDFRKYFEEPILASRQPSADEDVISLGEERAMELNHHTSWFILRRTQEVINNFLPTRQELVVLCRSTPLQQAMYESVVDYWESRGQESGPEEVAHLGVITALKKICNHPSLVILRQSESLPGEEDITHHLTQNYPVQDDAIFPQQSGKLDVVIRLLEALKCTKEKVVLVSYFTQTLDLLANMCVQKQYKFSRLDGSTPSTQRMKIVKNFNSPHSDNFVFLLSAKAGGVGLNLTGASRLVLYDSDWNPATDLQAMSRIWRDGQMRSVYIYRLLTTGTIEEKIFQRQISKTGLSGAVVDPRNQSTIRLSNEELKDLFTFHRDSTCTTHEMLGCKCTGVGLVPHGDLQLQRNLSITEDELSSQRDCQLQVVQTLASNTCVRMNQLFQWQHYSQPIGATLLQELGLSGASHNITFIFRNLSHSQTIRL